MKQPAFTPNPFANRAMIAAPRDFFGRRGEIDQLLGRVLGGSKLQSAALVGQRRIGKSSLFRRLLEEIPARAPGAAVAYYDLEAARKLTAGKFHSLVLGRLARAAGLARPPGLPEADAYDALVEFLEDHEGTRRFVLLLDEFDTVTSNPNFDADFFGSLRYLVNNHDLAMITSSYQDLTELCHAEEVRQSPFFNVFTTLDLGLMDGHDAEELVRTLSARGGRPFDAPQSELVLRLGGRYPFFVQVAGSALWELGRETGRFSPAEVEKRFRDEAIPHFRYFHDHLDDPEREALGALVRGETPPAPLLRRLERRSLVVEEPGGGHGLFSPVFLDYIREWADTGSGPPRAVEAAAARSRTPRAARSGDTERPPSSLHGAETTLVRHELEPHVVVGARYELARRLGSGTFGIVWEASDRVLGRQVALKFLRLEDWHLDPERGDRVKRFDREARALARMKHPNVVTVHDMGEWEGRPFLVMELVEGGTLADRLEQERQLPVPEALSLVRQAALGLDHAHGLGVIHRDVKPANLMLEPGGRLRVGDFGILRFSSATSSGAEALTAEGRAVGTPAYMAPELLLPGADIDHRVDVYALGVVLYECLAGHRPFVARDYEGVARHVLFDEAPDLRGYRPDVAPELVSLVHKAMAKDPAQRLGTAAELARALSEPVPGSRPPG